MNMTELLNMKLHSVAWVEGDTQVLRVPGGWIYRVWNVGAMKYHDSVFIPEPDITIRKNRTMNDEAR